MHIPSSDSNISENSAYSEHKLKHINTSPLQDLRYTFTVKFFDWSPGIHLQESESVSQPSLYPSIQSSFHIHSLISPSHSHPRVFSSRWRGRWWCCGESWRGETRLFGASPPPWPSSPPEWRIWRNHLQSDLTESVCILYMHSLCCVYIAKCISVRL